MEKKAEVGTVERIQARVYEIRGQQVMLDFDLAEIYGYEVKNLNRQVKRNMERFPGDFMFQLTKEEYEYLRCQNVTAIRSSMSRSMPYAFTEQGIYMLATVLRGELAEQQSIFIMRAFREMRHYIKQNQQFVTGAEMRLVNARVSELSVQMASLNDRWIVVDYGLPSELVYHCGASAKDAGKKLCALNKLENTAVIHPVIDALLLGSDQTI